MNIYKDKQPLKLYFEYMCIKIITPKIYYIFDRMDNKSEPNNQVKINLGQRDPARMTLSCQSQGRSHLLAGACAKALGGLLLQLPCIKNSTYFLYFIFFN